MGEVVDLSHRRTMREVDESIKRCRQTIEAYRQFLATQSVMRRQLEDSIRRYPYLVTSNPLD